MKRIQSVLYFFTFFRKRYCNRWASTRPRCPTSRRRRTWPWSCPRCRWRSSTRTTTSRRSTPTCSTSSWRLSTWSPKNKPGKCKKNPLFLMECFSGKIRFWKDLILWDVKTNELKQSNLNYLSVDAACYNILQLQWTLDFRTFVNQVTTVLLIESIFFFNVFLLLIFPVNS